MPGCAPRSRAEAPVRESSPVPARCVGVRVPGRPVRVGLVLAIFVAGLAVALQAPSARAAAEPDYRKALETSQAAIGRTTGEFRFTDSAGRPVTLAQLRDKPLVVSFVYTGCFQACPVATQFLAQRGQDRAQGAGRRQFPGRLDRLQPALRFAAGDGRVRAAEQHRGTRLALPQSRGFGRARAHPRIRLQLRAHAQGVRPRDAGERRRRRAG